MVGGCLRDKQRICQLHASPMNWAAQKKASWLYICNAGDGVQSAA
jgi:hypothetical protein